MTSLAHDLQLALTREPIDLARAALVIARIENPHLDAARSLQELDRLGARAADRFARLTGPQNGARVAALNILLYEEEGFAANRDHYDDFRNSLLNEVLDRRLGIPITLALVYMQVAGRAGLAVQGVSFPGHFLMRLPAHRQRTSDNDRFLILDPFEGGSELDDEARRALLARHIGADEAMPVDPALLRPCTERQMLIRILHNLKRTYVEARSYPQARETSTLLLAIDPTLHVERRDRGLLSFHLNDFAAALQDLEEYLRINRWAGETDREERDQIWDHVKTLRRRVAGWN